MLKSDQRWRNGSYFKILVLPFYYFLRPKIKGVPIFWQGLVSGKWHQPMFQTIFWSPLLLSTSEIWLDWCQSKISCHTVVMKRGSAIWNIEKTQKVGTKQNPKFKMATISPFLVWHWPTLYQNFQKSKHFQIDVVKLGFPEFLGQYCHDI